MKKLVIFIILTGLLLAPVTAKKVEIVFFHTPGCDFCAQVDEWLDELQVEYGDDVTIRKVDVTTREGWNEFKNFGFNLTPAVAVNGTKLESEQITKESLIAAIEGGGQVQQPDGSISLLALIFGIISGTTACVLAVAAFMFAMVTNRESKFTNILFTALSFGLGLIAVFMVMAALLGIGSYSLTGGTASTVRFYVSLALAYLVLVLGINQFNYAFEFVKLPVSTKRFFERILEGTVGKKGYFGAFIFGILFAPVKLPCAIPALGMVVERIILEGDLAEGLLLATMYGIGVLIPLVIVAIISGGSAQYASKLRWSETYRKVSWGIGGVVVLAVAVWIFWNTFKIPEEVTEAHYIALIGFGIATAIIMALFVKYGAVITKSKTWKRASRALQKRFR